MNMITVEVSHTHMYQQFRNSIARSSSVAIWLWLWDSVDVRVLLPLLLLGSVYPTLYLSFNLPCTLHRYLFALTHVLVYFICRIVLPVI